MTTQTIYEKELGIITGTNWNAPQINFSYWHVLSGFVMNETLTLDNVEMAYQDVLDTPDSDNKAEIVRSAAAFVDWFRDYYEVTRNGRYDAVSFSEEVCPIPNTGKQLGFVENSNWSAPSLPTDFWLEMTKYIQNEALTLEDVEMAHEDFMYDLNAGENNTALIEKAQTYLVWLQDYFKSQGLNRDDSISILE